MTTARLWLAKVSQGVPVKKAGVPISWDSSNPAMARLVAVLSRVSQLSQQENRVGIAGARKRRTLIELVDDIYKHYI